MVGPCHPFHTLCVYLHDISNSLCLPVPVQWWGENVCGSYSLSKGLDTVKGYSKFGFNLLSLEGLIHWAARFKSPSSLGSRRNKCSSFSLLK